MNTLCWWGYFQKNIIYSTVPGRWLPKSRAINELPNAPLGARIQYIWYTVTVYTQYTQYTVCTYTFLLWNGRPLYICILYIFESIIHYTLRWPPMSPAKFLRVTTEYREEKDKKRSWNEDDVNDDDNFVASCFSFFFSAIHLFLTMKYELHSQRLTEA